MGLVMAALARPIAFALALAVLLGVVGLPDFAFTDYDFEALTAATALAEGRLGAFYETAPAYGGSFVLRAPFAWVAHAFGGGELAVYRAYSLPAILAALALGGVLFARLRGCSRRGAWVALGLAVAHPLSFGALEFGHPEELLGAALCAGALLAAVAGRPWLAGMLLGAAVGNKAWALLAVLPVLAALPDGRGRVQAAGLAGAVVAVVAVPFALAGGVAVDGARAVATTTGSIFNPWQLFWFTGDAGGEVPNAPRPGYRLRPDWARGWSHPLVIAGGLGLGAAWVLVRRRIAAASPADAGLALALVLLTRCLLDTWNVAYYSVPFVLVLLTWECGLHRRPPVLSAAVAIASMISFNALVDAPPDLAAAVYLAWTLPLWTGMALALLAPARGAALAAAGRAAAARALPSLLGQPASSATAARRSPGLTSHP